MKIKNYDSDISKRNEALESVRVAEKILAKKTKILKRIEVPMGYYEPEFLGLFFYIRKDNKVVYSYNYSEYCKGNCFKTQKHAEKALKIHINN